MHKEIFDAYIYMRISDNGELQISSYCMADNFLEVVIFMIFVVNLTVTKISTIKSYIILCEWIEDGHGQKKCGQLLLVLARNSL